VDELNAMLGLVAADSDLPAKSLSILERIQGELFQVGAELSAPPEKENLVKTKISEKNVLELESEIDALEKNLEPLKNFILPGGGQTAATLHVARTIARRAEREVLILSQSEKVGEVIIQYLNRLSDLLFVLARWVNHQLGEKETIWNG